MCFGISFRKFLRFTVYKKGIDLDQAKSKAIEAMEPPKTFKQLKSFHRKSVLRA